MQPGEQISPSRTALTEALQLTHEILKNLELSEIPLTNIALKASRLARLVNDSEHEDMFRYEASGYPSNPDGLLADVYNLAILAGRKVPDTDSVYTTTISELEEQIRITPTSLSSAVDPDISLSSANPMQTVSAMGTRNNFERQNIRTNHILAVRRLASCRGLIHSYVLRRHYELKFSGVADDVFTRIRRSVDDAIGTAAPNAVRKLTAIYENLSSENPEDWSNAVHGCRRILQELADAMFPPTDEVRTFKLPGGKEQRIKLGPDQYINRLVAFVQDHSESERFIDIVGSHLEFLGDRLDAVFRAAQKGSHAEIVTRAEADRYVVYTYMLVGDLLSLN
jgi:hypothetical protein